MTAGTKWLIAIVGLLAGNVLAVMILIGAAHNGGSRVIPSYYEKATRYDDDIDQAAKNRTLGWHVEAAITNNVIQVAVSDREGSPLPNAHVHVVAAPRAESQRPLEVELVDGRAEYRVNGLVDLTIAIDRGVDRYVLHTTVEAR